MYQYIFTSLAKVDKFFEIFSLTTQLLKKNKTTKCVVMWSSKVYGPFAVLVNDTFDKCTVDK
jgi:hypothetical protein